MTVAKFIKRIVINREEPRKVKPDVVEFRKAFQDVHYRFESAKKAYEQIKLH